jgi:hypothetical protein
MLQMGEVPVTSMNGSVDGTTIIHKKSKNNVGGPMHIEEMKMNK